jgi:hypothetical protein
MPATTRPLPSVIGNSHRVSNFGFLEYLLFLKLRDGLGSTRFDSGEGDLIASMQRV